MAWNPHPDVAVCRDIAQKHGEEGVIVLRFKTINGQYSAASYGKTKEMCKEMGRRLDILCGYIQGGAFDA